MNEDMARTIPGKALRVLLAIVLVIGTCMVMPSTAQAIGEDAGSNDVWVDGYKIDGGNSSVNGGVGYVTEKGGTAYCFDYDAEGPYPNGANYTHIKRGSNASDYLVAKGYPNTTHIAGSNWSNADAQAITQLAAWIVSGTATDEAIDKADDDIASAAKTLAKEAQAYSGGDEDIDGCSCILYVDGKTEIQCMLTGNLFGHISLKKVSSITSITNDNGAYDLSKVKYGIYTDKACTESYRGYHLTFDADHNDGLDIMPGTYYVKETQAPEGYALDETVYPVEVKAGKTAKLNGGKVEDTPQSNQIDLILVKVDANTGNPVAQGDATLAGAQFKCEYFDNTEGSTSGSATRTWTFQTDADGKVHLGNKASGYLVSGDNLYKNSSGEFTFPLGTYKFTETVAPEGYNLTTESQTMIVKSSGTSEQTDSYVKFGNTKKIDGAARADDSVIRGGVMINKQDVETGTDEQGDATFEGASFAITNTSAAAVYVEGTLYEPGDVVKTIVTNEDGVASTSTDCLPYGSYRIDEVEAPVGYLNTGTISRSFMIREEGQMVDLTNTKPIENDAIRGGVMIQKNDIELGESEAIGGKDHSSTVGANLNGIEFTIVNQSAHRVVVDGESYDPGETIMTITTVWNADELAYTAQTEERTLPYGTYTVQETATNDSYLLTDGTPKTFVIRRDSIIVRATSDGQDLTFSDQVIRQDLRVTKKAAGAANTSLQVPFAITNVTTGETHVMCTDRNGDFSTASAWNKHSVNTNGNDWLMDADVITADDMDSRAGIWFGLGEDGSMADVDDSLAALPYGEYQLTELRCEANEGYQLISKTFWVERDSTAAEPIWMSLTDEEGPQVQTEATDAADGDHVVQASGEVTIVDTVYYTNLTPGTAYHVSGTLMVKQTGEALTDADGNAVTGEADFTCKTSDGTVQITFTFDGSLLAGQQLVAFEDVTTDGLEVCCHADIDDEGQTVTVVDIHTTATDAADGDKVVTDVDATIADDVSFEGLTPGEEYTLEATLMDAATGNAVTDEDGNAVTATAAFTPEEESGSAIVEIAFDASGLDGHSLVVFEKLYDCDGNLVASHEDLSDEGQTVIVDITEEPETPDTPDTPEDEDTPSTTTTTTSTPETSTGTYGKTGVDLAAPIAAIVIVMCAGTACAVYAIRRKRK